jgi:hypothetical protein
VCSCEDCDEPKEELLVVEVSSKKEEVVPPRKLCKPPSKKGKQQQHPRLVVHNGVGGGRVDAHTANGSCDSCQSAQKTPANKWSARCPSQQSHDCGYSSEGNETISGSCSLPSSPEGSEVACSDGFCNHEGLRFLACSMAALSDDGRSFASRRVLQCGCRKRLRN